MQTVRARAVAWKNLPEASSWPPVPARLRMARPDALDRSMRHHTQPNDTARMLMTRAPTTAAADDLLLDAAARMADRNVRHLPVVDGDRARRRHPVRPRRPHGRRRFVAPASSGRRSGSARPRAHAGRSGTDQARDDPAAAGELPALPRGGHPDLPAARRRRRLQGLRRARGVAVRGGARRGREDGLFESGGGWNEAGARARRGRPPGRLRRLPRSEVDAPARDAPGVHPGDPRAGRERRADAPHREHRALAQVRSRAPVRSQRGRVPPGDALVRLRAVPRRVLLRAEDDAVLPLEPGTEGRTNRTDVRRLQVPRRPPLLRLAARRDRRRGAEGAASGVRALEPGHPRALGRRMRRLPHAVPSARAR